MTRRDAQRDTCACARNMNLDWNAMATNLETANVKGLFNFFRLCGKLKVGGGKFLFYDLINSFITIAAP